MRSYKVRLDKFTVHLEINSSGGEQGALELVVLKYSNKRKRKKLEDIINAHCLS